MGDNSKSYCSLSSYSDVFLETRFLRLLNLTSRLTTWAVLLCRILYLRQVIVF